MQPGQVGDAIVCNGQLLNSDEAEIKYAVNVGTEPIEPGKFIAKYPNGVGLPTEKHQEIVGVAIDSIPARQGGYQPGQQCYYAVKGEIALKIVSHILSHIPVGVMFCRKSNLKPGDLATQAAWDVAARLPVGAVVVKQGTIPGAIVPVSVNFPG